MILFLCISNNDSTTGINDATTTLLNGVRDENIVQDLAQALGKIADVVLGVDEVGENFEQDRDHWRSVEVFVTALAEVIVWE